MNSIQLFEGQEVSVRTDKGIKLINLSHTAKYCGLINMDRGKERISWKNRNGVVDKLNKIYGADAPQQYLEEITYILDEIENADDRNSIYMSSWLSKRLALECNSPKANKFKDFLVTLDENREEQLSSSNESLELANYMLNIAQANQVTNEVVTGILKSVGKIREYVKDSIQAKDYQIDKVIELIGIRSKNTHRLIGKLKSALFDNYGEYISAIDIRYINSKDRVFKEFKVDKWEDIPVSKYNAIEAFIDEVIRK